MDALGHASVDVTEADAGGGVNRKFRASAVKLKGR